MYDVIKILEYTGHFLIMFSSLVIMRECFRASIEGHLGNYSPVYKCVYIYRVWDSMTLVVIHSIPYACKIIDKKLLF